jgi:AmmeMemoRadiSam system protein A
LFQLEPSDRKLLLALARHSVEQAVSRPSHDQETGPAPTEAMTRPAAAFVTLHELGELRGCIGLMRYEVPLWVNVREAAAAAALDDPRFRPVEASELGDLSIEVSVLEPPVDLPDPTGFVAGRHGIIVERGLRHALLLPQGADEMGWDSARMLDAVCRKAGLPGDGWRDPATRLLVFESVCFGESDPAE